MHQHYGEKKTPVCMRLILMFFLLVQAITQCLNNHHHWSCCLMFSMMMMMMVIFHLLPFYKSADLSYVCNIIIVHWASTFRFGWSIFFFLHSFSRNTHTHYLYGSWIQCVFCFLFFCFKNKIQRKNISNI